MKLFRILTVLILLCASAVEGWSLDRDAFTFVDYKLDVRIEPQQQRLAVRGKVTLRNDSVNPQKDVALQISSSLDWRSIQFNGKPVQFVSQPYTSDIDHTGALSEAIVSLPSAVPPKGTAEFEIGYEGVIPLDTTRLTRSGAPEQAARHIDWDQISSSFSALRGIGYVAWYPIATQAASLSVPNDVPQVQGRWKAKAADSTMDVNFCVDHGKAANPLVLADGQEVGGGGIGGVISCSRFIFSGAEGSTASFAIGQYSEVKREHVAIEYLADHKLAAEDYVLAVDLATPFVTDWFGVPRQKPTFIDLQDQEAAPFESGSILFAPLSVAADSRVAQMTAVHHLTHAAFDSPRSWIREGLAAFAQAAYREQQSGRPAALEFIGLYRPALLAAEKNAASEKDAAATESLINTSLPELQRGKAMYVWWMLRDMIGEVALKKSLAAYRPEQDKDPAYIQHLLEAQSKRDLESFFDDWVYRDRGLPDFRVDSAYIRPTVGGPAVVTVTIENLGAAGAEVPFTLQMETGKLTRRIAVPAKSKASTRVEVPSSPQKIVVNDGSVPESDLTNNSYTIEPASH
jgi:hypothetical protein